MSRDDDHNARPHPDSGLGPTLSAKHLRHLHTSLVTLHTTLTEEQHLLERIWYKSHAQFRTQRWFQSVDGVRKCLRELCGFKNGYERQVSAKKLQKREKATAARDEGHLNQTIRSLVSLYFFLADKPPGEEPANVLQKLPKLAFKWNRQSDDVGVPPPPPQYSDEHSLELTLHMALTTLQLIHLVLALQRRCQAAFAVLVTHLRTPPAPTFAPVVLILISVVAKISDVAKGVLQGTGSGPGAGATPTTTAETAAADPPSSSSSAEARPLDMIKTYHSFVDAIHLKKTVEGSSPTDLKPESSASTSGKRKRKTNDDGRRNNPHPTPLELTRYSKPLQTLVNTKRQSMAAGQRPTLTTAEQSVLKNHLPHRVTLPIQKQSRSKRRRSDDRLPGLKQLTNQRRNLLDEYESEIKDNRGGSEYKRRKQEAPQTKTHSTSSTLLDQFLPSKSSSGMFNIDDEEDVGLAV